MEYLYGKFSDAQVAEFKSKLHKKLFWLFCESHEGDRWAK